MRSDHVFDRLSPAVQTEDPASILSDTLRLFIDEIRSVREALNRLEIASSSTHKDDHIPAKLQHLLDIRDVSFVLKVSKRTVETLISEGQLVPIKIGKQRRFSREAVDSYIRSSMHRSSRRAA